VTPRGGRLAPRAIDVVESVDTTFFHGVREADAIPMLRTLAGISRAPVAR
jgi:hypothetical protein